MAEELGTTRQQQQAPARPTAQLQMETRSRASTPFVLDRPSKPTRLNRADTPRIDEEIVIRQCKSTQLISTGRETSQLPPVTKETLCMVFKAERR